MQEVESELKSVDALLSTIHSLAADVAEADTVKSVAGAAEEEALVNFTEEARRTCADTWADVHERPAAEFNNDDTYSALVKDAVDMKMKRALKGGHHYKLLGAWFAHCSSTRFFLGPATRRGGVRWGGWCGGRARRVRIIQICIVPE